MKPAYLLDSAVLIDHLRGIKAATDWLCGLAEGEAVISPITRAEVLSGGTKEEELAGYELCEKFECLPLTKECADRAAALRRENRWRLPDAFQAALAIQNGLRLVTRDARAFGAKKYPFALIPY